jgi:hypothetical protein
MMMGDEVGRLSFNQGSQDELDFKETTVHVGDGEVIEFWTEIDIEYENDLGLFFGVEVWLDDEGKAVYQMDALKTNPTLKQVSTSFGNKTSTSYTGKMNFVTIEKGGDYTFKVWLNTSDNPTLVVHQAELVLTK